MDAKVQGRRARPVLFLDRADGVDHDISRLGPRGRVLGKERQDQFIERGGYAGYEVPRSSRLISDERHEQHRRALGRERLLSRQHAIEHAAETEEIAAMVDILISRGLLR